MRGITPKTSFVVRVRCLKSRQKLEHEVGACLRAGDIEGAAAGVVHVCGPGVFGYLRVALFDERLARDAFSSFSEAVWSQLRRARIDAKLEVWVYRLAYCCAKQQRDATKPRAGKGKKVAREAGKSSPDRPARARTVAALSQTRAATLEPLGAVEDAELLRRELTLEEQTLLTLRIDRGFAWADIGYVLGARTGRAETLMLRRYERLVARLHRLAIARGVLAAGPLPANLEALSITGRSSTRDA